MIDLHSHLLPELDDGAQSLDMAEEMARRALEDGIEIVVATPHSGPSEERTDVKKIMAALARLRDRLESCQIPLKVLPGEEIAISSDLVEQLQTGKVLPDSRLHNRFRSAHQIASPDVL